MLKNIIKEGDEFENPFSNETLSVTKDQYNELVALSAITPDGFWLADGSAFNILAIGLDQMPGYFSLELNLDSDLH